MTTNVSAQGTATPVAGPEAAPAAKPGLARRLAPLAILLAVMGVVFATGLHRYLSLSALAENRALLGAFVNDNLVLSFLAFGALYIVAVVLSLPGATILTVASGLLFGWVAGGAVSVIAATLGATGIFLVARSAAGSALTSKAGPWLDKLAGGFRNDAFSYLLFLRLAPIFPFWLVNLAPAILGVKLSTYVTATLVGIIPGTFTFAVVGAGLDSIIDAQREACAGAPDCTFDLSVSSLVTPEIIAAFALLATLALIPPAAKRLMARKSVAEDDKITPKS